jgi:hypothetical protein
VSDLAIKNLILLVFALISASGMGMIVAAYSGSTLMGIGSAFLSFPAFFILLVIIS